MTRAFLFVLLAACAPEEPAVEAVIDPIEAPPTPDAVLAPADVVVSAEPATPTKGLVVPITPDALKAMLAAPSAKPRLYNFWATWCGPCVAELPALTAFAKDHPEIDVVLVNVDMASIRESKVAPFLVKRGVTGVTSLQLDTADPAGELPKILADWPDTIPVSLFVKPDGTRAKQFNGAVRAEDLQIGLDASLG